MRRVLLHVQETGEDWSQWHFNLRAPRVTGGKAPGGGDGRQGKSAQSPTFYFHRFGALSIVLQISLCRCRERPDYTRRHRESYHERVSHFCILSICSRVHSSQKLNKERQTAMTGGMFFMSRATTRPESLSHYRLMTMYVFIGDLQLTLLHRLISCSFSYLLDFCVNELFDPYFRKPV